MNGEQCHLKAVRSSQLVVNMTAVVFDRLDADSKLPGYLPIRAALNHQRNYFQLARCQPESVIVVRGAFEGLQGLNDRVSVLCSHPVVPCSNRPERFGQHLDCSGLFGKDAMRASLHGVQHVHRFEARRQQKHSNRQCLTVDATEEVKFQTVRRSQIMYKQARAVAKRKFQTRSTIARLVDYLKPSDGHEQRPQTLPRNDLTA